MNHENLDFDISVISDNGRGLKKILSRSIFFLNQDYISIKLEDNFFTIKKHYIEIPKNAIKVSLQKVKGLDRRYQLSTKINLPLGRYNFCKEESTEDEAVIYFNQEENESK